MNAHFRLSEGILLGFCIKMDLSKPLKQRIWLGCRKKGIFQVVSYKNLLSVCFKCGCVGHKSKACHVSLAYVNVSPQVEGNPGW